MAAPYHNNNSELAGLMREAAYEIDNLRKQRDLLAAQMSIVEVFRAALLGPPHPQGYGMDIAHALRKEAEAMQAHPVPVEDDLKTDSGNATLGV